MLAVSKMDGKQAHFGFVLLKHEMVEPQFISGFHLWVCRSCGYSELFDGNVAKTIKNMEPGDE